MNTPVASMPHDSPVSAFNVEGRSSISDGDCSTDDEGYTSSSSLPPASAVGLPLPKECVELFKQVSAIADPSDKDASIKDVKTQADDASHVHNKRLFYGRLVTLTASIISLTAASIALAAMPALAAPLFVCSLLSFAVAAGNAYDAYRHCALLKAGEKGLPLGGDFIGNVLHGLLVKMGKTPQEAEMMAEVGAALIHLSMAAVNMFCVSMPDVSSLAGTLDHAARMTNFVLSGMNTISLRIAEVNKRRIEQELADKRDAQHKQFEDGFKAMKDQVTALRKSYENTPQPHAVVAPPSSKATKANSAKQTSEGGKASAAVIFA